MPGGRVTRDGQATRERIIAAGTMLFERNGYHGTSVQELTEVVGLGRGGLYHHISSKEELLFEISKSLLDIAIARGREVIAQAGNPASRLRALARSLVEQHMQHEAGWTVALREARALTPEHRKLIIQGRDEYEGLWAEVFDQGVEAGLWRSVNETELRGILGMFNSTGRWMRPGGRLNSVSIADCYIDLLLQGIGGPGLRADSTTADRSMRARRGTTAGRGGEPKRRTRPSDTLRA